MNGLFLVQRPTVEIDGALLIFTTSPIKPETPLVRAKAICYVAGYDLEDLRAGIYFGDVEETFDAARKFLSFEQQATLELEFWLYRFFSTFYSVEEKAAQKACLLTEEVVEIARDEAA